MRPYTLLAAQIREELTLIEQVAARAQEKLAEAQLHPDVKSSLLEAAALNLQGFYAGLEHIFHRITASVDRSVPTGHEWHRELMFQISLALPSVRPRVLSEASLNLLSGYLGFRHVVRNIYPFQLDLRRVEQLVQELPPVVAQVRDDLLLFVTFLEEAGSDPE